MWGQDNSVPKLAWHTGEHMAAWEMEDPSVHPLT